MEMREISHGRRTPRSRWTRSPGPPLDRRTPGCASWGTSSPRKAAAKASLASCGARPQACGGKGSESASSQAAAMAKGPSQRWVTTTASPRSCARTASSRAGRRPPRMAGLSTKAAHPRAGKKRLDPRRIGERLVGGPRHRADAEAVETTAATGCSTKPGATGTSAARRRRADPRQPGGVRDRGAARRAAATARAARGEPPARARSPRRRGAELDLDGGEAARCESRGAIGERGQRVGEEERVERHARVRRDPRHAATESPRRCAIRSKSAVSSAKRAEGTASSERPRRWSAAATATAGGAESSSVPRRSAAPVSARWQAAVVARGADRVARPASRSRPLVVDEMKVAVGPGADTMADA